MAIYKAKGYITFVFSASKDGTANLTSTTRTIDDMVNGATEYIHSEETKQIYRQMYTADLTRKTYHLMSGKEFLENVLDGNFIDYDGSIAKIYVDGFESNLGLCAGGICQGKLLVNEVVWRDLCKAHKIEVDWANK